MIRESGADRARQAAVAARLEAAWGIRAHAMPERFPFDYLLHNAAGRDDYAAAEIKCRTCVSTAYPSLVLDLAKLARLRDWARWLGAPALLVAAYADGVAEWLDVRTLDGPLEVRIGGRADRGDPADIDALVHLPHSRFRRLP